MSTKANEDGRSLNGEEALNERGKAAMIAAQREPRSTIASPALFSTSIASTMVALGSMTAWDVSTASRGFFKSVA